MIIYWLENAFITQYSYCLVIFTSTYSYPLLCFISYLFLDNITNLFVIGFRNILFAASEDILKFSLFDKLLADVIYLQGD